MSSSESKKINRILVVGDAPNMSSGLARIARDLTSLLSSRQVQGRIELTGGVAQLGLNYDGSPWPWRVYPVTDPENWGAGDIEKTVDWCGGPEGLGIFTVWDPGRVLPYAEYRRRTPKLGGLWGYFAVDSSNREGRLGGPIGETLAAYDRVLGYTRFGATVLAATLGDGREVEAIPHGIVGEPWKPHKGVYQARLRRGDVDLVIGAVGTNTFRKDWGWFFEALRILREVHKKSLAVWVGGMHREVTEAWSIPELARLSGMDGEAMELTIGIDDAALALRYSECDVTVGIGLGEGFGYPIAESLACGTPVVIPDYAGGPEILSRADWCLPAESWRVEGAYCLVRPVMSAGELAQAIIRAAEEKKGEPSRTQAYCTGMVAHLRYERGLARAWEAWFGAGLKEGR